MLNFSLIHLKLYLLSFSRQFREYYKMSQGGFMKNLPREALPNAQEINAEDSVPWYLRYGARVLATLGGLRECFAR